MKLGRYLGLLAVGLLLAGCLKVEQTLTINKDGSGLLAMDYGMSQQTIDQMKAMQKMAQAAGATNSEQDKAAFEFDEKEIMGKFKDMEKDGIKLVKLDSEVTNGWKYIHALISFTSLEKMQKAEFFDNNLLSLKKRADGNYELVQNSNAEYGTAEETGMNNQEMQDAMLQQMAPMLKGMKIVLRVKVPGKVIETNANEKDDNSVAWIYDIDKDPKDLQRLQRASMRVVFEGQGVTLPEIHSSAAGTVGVEPAKEEASNN